MNQPNHPNGRSDVSRLVSKRRLTLVKLLAVTILPVGDVETTPRP